MPQSKMDFNFQKNAKPELRQNEKFWSGDQPATHTQTFKFTPPSPYQGVKEMLDKTEPRFVGIWPASV